MASYVAFQCYDIYFRFYSTIKCTPFSWDPKKRRLTQTKSKFSLIHQIGVDLFGVVMTAYCSGRLLKEMFFPDETFKPHQIIMYIFYTLIIVMSTALSLVFLQDRVGRIDAFNGIIRFHERMENWLERLKPSRKGEKVKVRLYERILKYMLPGTVAITICGASLSLAAPLDPLQRLLIDHFPGIYWEFESYIKVFAFLAIPVCGTYIWSPIILLTKCGIIYTNITSYWLTVLNGNAADAKSLPFRKYLKDNPFQGQLIYRQMTILNSEANRTIGKISVPIIISTTALVAIISNFATVKMYGVIPMPGFLMMPGACIVLYTGMGSGLPYCTRINTESDEYINQIKFHPDNYIRRVAKSFRPINARVGNFFSIRRGTTLAYFRFITDFSIDLIMSIKL